MKVIALTGGYRAGKTTLANRLNNILYDSKHIALADPLKRVAVKYHPNLAPQIYAEEKTPETRRFLFNMSEQIKSRLGERVFMDDAFRRACFRNPQFLIISDCRFMMEFEELQNHNTLFINVGPIVDQYDIVKAYSTIDSRRFFKVPAKPNLDAVLPIILRYFK